MITHTLRLGVAVAVLLTPSLAGAQHEAHRAASPESSNADVAQCLRVQTAIDGIITNAMNRAEASRLSNAPTELRAAVESLEAALRDIRAQSAPCSAAAASADPPAAHSSGHPHGDTQMDPKKPKP